MDLRKHTKDKQGSVNELVSFFDLLARYDFEDKKKEKSVIGIGSVVSAPTESVPETDVVRGRVGVRQ